jgi:hypothetical protein
MYPFSEQQNTKTRKPYFFGFSGMYYCSEFCLWKPLIRLKNLSGLNACLKNLFR